MTFNLLTIMSKKLMAYQMEDFNLFQESFTFKEYASFQSCLKLYKNVEKGVNSLKHIRNK